MFPYECQNDEKSSSSLYDQAPWPEADDLMWKWCWCHLSWEVTPGKSKFHYICPIGEEITGLLICVCCLMMMYWTMERDTRWQIWQKKRLNSLRFCCWPADVYTYVKIYAFLVILMLHVSVVAFRLGKKPWRIFEVGDMLAHPSLIIVRRAQGQVTTATGACGLYSDLNQVGFTDFKFTDMNGSRNP